MADNPFEDEKDVEPVSGNLSFPPSSFACDRSASLDRNKILLNILDFLRASWSRLFEGSSTFPLGVVLVLYPPSLPPSLLSFLFSPRLKFLFPFLYSFLLHILEGSGRLLPRLQTVKLTKKSSKAALPSPSSNAAISARAMSRRRGSVATSDAYYSIPYC